MTRFGVARSRWRSLLVAGGALSGVTLASAVAAAVFVASLPALRIYRVDGSIVDLMAAAIFSTAISFAVARWWKQVPLVSFGLSLAGMIVLLLVGAGSHAGDIVHQFVRDPNIVLTETLPVGGSLVVLTPMIVLTWVTGAATAEIFARSKSLRFGAILGLAFPIALFVVTYFVAASAPGREFVAGPLLLVAIVLIAAIRRWEIDSTTTSVSEGVWAAESNTGPNGVRALGAALAVVAVIATALGFGVTSLPGMNDQPSSLHRQPSLLATQLIDPVDAMAQLRDGDPKAPARTMLSVDLSERSTGYLSVAVLNQYDGNTWDFDTTFEPTGGRIPQPAQTSVGSFATSAVDQSVTVRSSLPVPLLPVVDRPLSITGLSVLDDQETGMLLPAQSGHGALDYRVVSAAPDLTLSAVPHAEGIAPDPDSEDLELPADASSALTTTLRYFSNATGLRPAPSVSFLQSVLNNLQTKEARIDPALVGSSGASTTTPTSTATTVASPPVTLTPVTTFGGTSLSEVINAVTVDKEATPEQFATLFAMVARYVGVPARVVTGFRISGDSGGDGVAPGRYQVTDRQAWAWVEVPVSGIGWVVVDPTPDRTTGLVSAPPEQLSSTATTLPDRRANVVPITLAGGGHSLAKPRTFKIPRTHHRAWWVAVLLLAAGIVVLAGLAGPGQAAVRRLWRRNARKSADPAERAVGAWLEMLDGLNVAGMETAEGMTNSEIAEEAAIHFGPDVAAPLSEVGPIADAAVFCGEAAVLPPQADRAWELRREFLVKLRSGMDSRRRAASYLSVGSSPRRPSSSPRRPSSTPRR